MRCTIFNLPKQKMLKPLDHYWYSTNLISLLLLPLSGLFCLLSRLRVMLYRLGILKSFKAPVPVIIVGNISVGGTGKTPLIIELVKQLKAKGFKPGVISRGYGGKAGSWPQKVTQTTTAELVGDEPQLIFDQTACPVVVGPDRRKTVTRLLNEFACDIVLSDDGMQHYALQRDIEIAVVDAQREFGNGFCLPSGPLRETVSRLQQVDLVILNGGTEDQYAFSMQADNCLSAGSETSSHEALSLSDFAGKTVHAIAGIGNPERFFSMLKQHDIDVIPHAFADHYNYQQADLLFNDQNPVLMTEKDAVKCKAYTLANHWSVPVTIKLTPVAQEKINQLIDSLGAQSNSPDK